MKTRVRGIEPQTWAVVKIAQRIHEEWRAEDKLDAEEQRAQAEATSSD
jgi:hypothetical protein